MVTIGEALELIKAGFTVDDIRNMDKPADHDEAQKQPETKKPEAEKKVESEIDTRLNALTGVVEKLVDTVGKLPFAYNMGKDPADDADAILASIINPPKKEAK